MSLKFQNTNAIKEHHGKPIYCVTFNTYDPANQDLLASVGGHQATVYRCHPQGRIEVLQVYVDDHTRQLNDDPPEHEDFYVCKWSVDAATGDPLLLLAGKLALIRVVNCRKKQAVRTLKGHGKDVNDVAVHPVQPHVIISASKDHSIRLWNINQACCVLLMRGPGAHIGEVITLDFHPWDPHLFVSGAMEGAVKVWSLKEHWMGIKASEGWQVTPEQRAFPVRLVGHPVFSSHQVHNNGYVDCCRWLGDLVLSKSVDYKIKLWRPHYPNNPILETSSKFTLLRVFDFSGEVMWWLRFSLDPYGQVLACGNTSGKTFIWSPGQAKASRAVELRHKNCTAVIRQTAVSMDGSTIICSTEDAQLWRWDRQQGAAAAGTDRQQQQQQHTGSRKGSKAAAASAAAGTSSGKWLGAAGAGAAAAEGPGSDGASDADMEDAAAETQVGAAGAAGDASQPTPSPSPPPQQQQPQQRQQQQQPKPKLKPRAEEATGAAAGAAWADDGPSKSGFAAGDGRKPRQPAAAAAAAGVAQQPGKKDSRPAEEGADLGDGAVAAAAAAAAGKKQSHKKQRRRQRQQPDVEVIEIDSDSE